MREIATGFAITRARDGITEGCSQDAIRQVVAPDGSVIVDHNPKGTKTNFRTWTDDTGQHKTEAEFICLTDGVVTLNKVNGSLVAVPLDRLARFDQALARNARGKFLFTAKVVGVANGDTITVLDEIAQTKIRLNGIDTPESRQAFGAQAKKALSEKVFGKSAQLVWKEKDFYGRTVADVYVDGRYVNGEMVTEGLAWHYTAYSTSLLLANAQKRAQDAKAGLWADAAPIPPWDFRWRVTPAQPVTRHERLTPAARVTLQAEQ